MKACEICQRPTSRRIKGAGHKKHVICSNCTEALKTTAPGEHRVGMSTTVGRRCRNHLKLPIRQRCEEFEVVPTASPLSELSATPYTLGSRIALDNLIP